ncbi:hypothetical protein SAMN05216525_101121 [Bradyrhizobium sp. Gha]|nr:hypothetical protein SAMN05216525_101121 [Bradyrhizobium sp. Gha]
MHIETRAACLVDECVEVAVIAQPPIDLKVIDRVVAMHPAGAGLRIVQPSRSAPTKPSG